MAAGTLAPMPTPMPPLTLTFGHEELAIRPALRLARHLHLQRIATVSSTVGTSSDF